ncbi:MAG: hypothetical protein RIQ60_83 [Pseudomonadota bacterium]|jgi:hypothetical protein
MKRLRQFDFLAPPTRPWAGYSLLMLAGAVLLCLGWLIWATRAPEALSPLPQEADVPLRGSLPQVGVVPASPQSVAALPASVAGDNLVLAGSPTFASAAGVAAVNDGASAPLAGLAVEAALPAPPASGAANTTVTAAVAQGTALQATGIDPAALREQYQLRQTRSIGGPLALPWAELLIVVQNQLRSGITLQRLEPDTGSAAPPLQVRLTAVASDEARMLAFIEALKSDARLHDVKLSPTVAEDADSAARRGSSPGQRFALLMGWRGAGDVARRAGNPPAVPTVRP